MFKTIFIFLSEIDIEKHLNSVRMIGTCMLNSLAIASLHKLKTCSSNSIAGCNTVELNALTYKHKFESRK